MKIRKIIYIINIIIIISILIYLAYIGMKKYRNNDPEDFVEFRGYSLKKESDLKYDLTEDNILLSSNTEGWNARIVLYKDPNDVIFQNAERMDAILRFKGNDVNELYIHDENNYKYITLEMHMPERNSLFGYVKLDSSHLCEITLNDIHDVNNYKYDAFERIVKLVKSAKYDYNKDQNYHYWTLTFDAILKVMEEQSEETTEE